MSNRTLIGGWVSRFLLKHWVAERNLAWNTQASSPEHLASDNRFPEGYVTGPRIGVPKGE